MLAGKKTYIVAALVGLVVVAVQLGFISADMGNTALGLLGATGLATLRMGVSNS
jgi:uncharacterized membrane protein YkgB|tara:strand:- start:7625 stop:7786 length:162 start_codon:yes stop_codon:yes gene_type:complete